MRIALPLLALCLLATPAAAQGTSMITPTAEQVGQVFCISRTGNDEAIARALLTPELSGALDLALAENDRLQQATPDEKPPLGDGIPWQAYPDYAAECAPGTATEVEGGIELEIIYGFPEAPDAGFTDKLLLKRSGEFLRIDNIFYANEGNLRDVVASVFNF